MCTLITSAFGFYEYFFFFFFFFFYCFVGCFSIFVWTPAVLSVLYACVLCFCICTCSAQLSMFYMKRHFRNVLIIVIITINRKFLLLQTWVTSKKATDKFESLFYHLKVCFLVSYHPTCKVWLEDRSAWGHFDVEPFGDRSCKSNLLSHPVRNDEILLFLLLHSQLYLWGSPIWVIFLRT